MCRRNNRWQIGRWQFAAACVVLLAFAGQMQSARAADDLVDFLQQHSLKRLLAVHLEKQVELAKPEDRGDLVLRLATLYADLLEGANDPVQRKDLEDRSRKLLEKAPSSSAEELRLALLRISYRVAEKTAENHRLRMATDAEVKAANEALTQIIPQIAALRQRLKQDVDNAERRLARSSGSRSILLTDAGDRIRNLYAQTAFLNAWALYYDAWLNDRADNARAAEALFASLLNSETPSPQPSDVSVDLRGNEAIARSILGMALAKSVTSSTATAIGWLNLLDDENTFEPLRRQAPAWKIAVYLQHREYQHVQELLAAAEIGEDGSPQKVPIAWLRLIAVHTIEDTQRSKVADELARTAVLELAARGELQQIMDLAKRYGPESLGTSGFALQYVNGMIRYQQARSAHGSDSPTLDATLVSQYQSAIDQLTAALLEPDATSFLFAGGAAGSPTSSCHRLIAWCLYFQSRFLEARDAFDDVSKELAGDDAAEALWMAIVCQDKIVEAGGDANSRTQLDALIERFLNQFPSNDHAPKLRLRKAVAPQQVSESSVEQLLAIPPGSEVYESAQRRAADMLYQLFRAATGDDRHFQANRFLSVAVGLLSPAGRSVDLASTGGGERFVVRCRQVLEVALADGIEKVTEARIALEALAELGDVPGVDLTGIADEIDCRRAQERLLQRDYEAAAPIADQLWAKEPASLWTRQVTRAMFRYGHAIWKNVDSSAEEKLRAAELVVRYGGRVLHEFTDAQESATSGAIGYQAAVAEASMFLWEQSGDLEKAKAALFLFDKLLAARPRNAAFLRSIAVLAEPLGDLNKALDCWRRLTAGNETGSLPWFEAKYHTIKILATTDPPRARQVMDQHKLLNPDFGPNPWGPLLKTLDGQIPQASDSDAKGETTP